MREWLPGWNYTILLGTLYNHLLTYTSSCLSVGIYVYVYIRFATFEELKVDEANFANQKLYSVRPFIHMFFKQPVDIRVAVKSL